MQVILLEKMQNLGELGDEVNVKPGFARNFLIPQSKAVPATPQHRAEFEARRAELEREQADVLTVAQSKAEAIEGLSISISRKAGEEGRLFGSVGTMDIAEALRAAGHEVERSAVRLPIDTIRQTGEYPVQIHMHADVEATVTVVVEPEV